ncbi:hypothetical protein UlMin_029511 [Ulmus minor]
MAEVGECSSGAKSSDDIWARLVPSDSRHSDIEIRPDEIVVCSVIRSSSVDKHEWCKIKRNSDLCSATMQNKSSNTILADEVIVQNEDTVVIKGGSEIIPGPGGEGYLTYIFKLLPQPETCPKQLKIGINVDNAKCSICLSVWHDFVTVAPCFHNFCNGCFSEWLRRSQEKHPSVLCPQCRAVVQFVGRNHFLHNIAEDILQADSSLSRSKDEVATLESYSSIQSKIVVKSGRRRNRKRAYSPLDDESHDAELQCPQCGLGCDRAFCGAYWHAQVVTQTDSQAICNSETFKPISEHTISRIPFWAHEKNRHEQDITEECIRQTGRTLQDVVAEWITKFNNREIDRTRMPLNHAEMITASTHVCNDCYEKVVSFLLYWYRITMPKHGALAREVCWYGYACRTQHHNEEHARKRNHVCRPNRASNIT